MNELHERSMINPEMASLPIVEAFLEAAFRVASFREVGIEGQIQAVLCLEAVAQYYDSLTAELQAYTWDALIAPPLSSAAHCPTPHHPLQEPGSGQRGQGSVWDRLLLVPCLPRWGRGVPRVVQMGEAQRRATCSPWFLGRKKTGHRQVEKH